MTKIYIYDIHYNNNMLRTQIFLPEDLYQKLLSLKKVRDISIGKIIREVLKKNLVEEEKNIGNDLLELAKLKIRGGPKDLSKRINHYLYSK